MSTVILEETSTTITLLVTLPDERCFVVSISKGSYRASVAVACTRETP